MMSYTGILEGNMTKFRTQLLYTSAYTPLVIWRTLWDYYHGKHANRSPIQVTDQLRKAVSDALATDKQTT